MDSIYHSQWYKGQTRGDRVEYGSAGLIIKRRESKSLHRVKPIIYLIQKTTYLYITSGSLEKDGASVLLSTDILENLQNNKIKNVIKYKWIYFIGKYKWWTYEK